MIAAKERRVVTLADGPTVSTKGSMLCYLRLTGDKNKPVFLKSVRIHMLLELAFDVIQGLPTIRRYNLLFQFAPLFTGKSLQIHN
jgi:hypothetical protein